MANVSSCDYCGEKDIHFSLKVKDEYGNQSNNSSVTSVSIERPCLIPICSAGLNGTIEFDFTNSHYKDVDISYKHNFYITKNGGTTEYFTTLPEGLGSAIIVSNNTFILSDGTIAAISGTYEDFSMSFSQQGTYDVRIVSTGINDEGYSSFQKSCIPPTLEDVYAYSFYTTKQTNIELIHDGGEGYIDWGDGTITSYDTAIDGFSFLHTYPSPGTYHVKVSCNPDDITSIDLANQELVDTLNIRKLNNLTSLLVNDNAGLETILNPLNNSEIWIEYNAENCSLNGVTDLSVFPNLGGILKLGNNSISNLLLPNTSELFTVFEINNNNITASLDLSSMNLSGIINLGYNTSLNGLQPPVTANIITYFDAQHAGIGGTFDCSVMPNMEGTLLLNFNSLTGLIPPSGLMNNVDLSSNFLTTNSTIDLSAFQIEGSFVIKGNDSFNFYTIIVPTNTVGVMTNIDFSNKINTQVSPGNLSGWTISSAAIINYDNTNQISSVTNGYLSQLDSILSGPATGIIHMAGVNAPPTTPGFGPDGIAAKNSLIAKGWTVNTN